MNQIQSVLSLPKSLIVEFVIWNNLKSSIRYSWGFKLSQALRM